MCVYNTRTSGPVDRDVRRDNNNNNIYVYNNIILYSYRDSKRKIIATRKTGLVRRGGNFSEH